MAATNDHYATHGFLWSNFFSVSSRDGTSEEECCDDNCTKCRDGNHGYKTKADAAALRNNYTATWITVDYATAYEPKQYKIQYNADGSWEAVWDVTK